MYETVTNLADLFSLIVKNPSLAKHFKSDPMRVAEMFGVTLSKESSQNFREARPQLRLKLGKGSRQHGGEGCPGCRNRTWQTQGQLTDLGSR